MAIADVIKFSGPHNALVWKFPIEDFNTASQLIVDETHEALLVINGNAADLFPPGRRTLTTGNIPLASKLVNIPTGGTSPFPCKVFFINKVHKMDLLWGTKGPIALEDPLYDIFMHVMAHGSMSVSVEDSRKFMLKLVGFQDKFSPEDLIGKFRGIISTHVKDCISKIMINGMLSYFMVNAHMFELAGVIKERLDRVFEDYGVAIQFFNLETIEVPESDYQAVRLAKERRTGRMIEGYTWQEERQMMIAEKFAGNEGMMGGTGGALSGLMVGGAVGSTIADIARNALDPARIPTEKSPKNAAGTTSHVGSTGVTDVEGFFKSKQALAGPAGSSQAAVGQKAGGQAANGQTAGQPAAGRRETRCAKCHAVLPEDAKFCLECGEKVAAAEPLGNICPGCGQQTPVGKFCLHCGTPLARKCAKCGTDVPANGKFCLECGEKL